MTDPSDIVEQATRQAPRIFTAAQMNNAIRAVMAAPAPVSMPLPLDPRKVAVLRAAEKYAGRNWRRIKREMNKAWKRGV